MHILLLATVVAAVECPRGTTLRQKTDANPEAWCEKPFPGKSFAVKHGPWKRWWTEDQLEVDASFREGQFHGEWRTWTKKGEPDEIGHYVDGKRSALWTKYLNGKKHSETEYVDDVQHGLFRMFHDNGRVAAEVEYRDGKPSGSHKTWDPDGQLRNSGRYEQGEKHGAWTFRNRSGAIILTLTYDSGKLTDRPKESRAQVTFLKAGTVASMVDPDALDSFMDLMAASVDDCVTGDTPALSFTVKWTIPQEGGATHWRVSGGGSNPINECIVSRMKKWEFPYPWTDGYATVQVRVK